MNNLLMFESWLKKEYPLADATMRRHTWEAWKAALHRATRNKICEMVSMRKVRKVLVNFDVSASVDDYEFRGDEGAYTPNDKDCVLLTDFAHGLIGELCEALGKLSAAEAEGRKG
jgi:hypothetical protein